MSSMIPIFQVSVQTSLGQKWRRDTSRRSALPWSEVVMVIPSSDQGWAKAGANLRGSVWPSLAPQEINLSVWESGKVRSPPLPSPCLPLPFFVQRQSIGCLRLVREEQGPEKLRARALGRALLRELCCTGAQESTDTPSASARESGPCSCHALHASRHVRDEGWSTRLASSARLAIFWLPWSLPSRSNIRTFACFPTFQRSSAAEYQQCLHKSMGKQPPCCSSWLQEHAYVAVRSALLCQQCVVRTDADDAGAQSRQLRISE